MSESRPEEAAAASLTDADLELLLRLNHRVAYEPEEVIVAAGEPVERLFLVEQGTFRVGAASDGHNRVLTRGQVFGSTSLLERRVAEHQVVAATHAAAVAVSADDLEWLYQAEPETAGRLWKAIALSLAARNLDRPAGAAAVAPPAEPQPRSDDFSLLAAACAEARAVLASLGEADDAAPSAWARARVPAVAAAMRPVMKALAGFMQDASGAERAQRAGAARHELQTLLGTSRLIEMVDAQAAGSPGWRIFDHIYRNRPEGDGSLGLLTDAWLLTRPFAEGIRERRTVASRMVTAEVSDRTRADRPVRILSLGCGPARSLADLLEETARPEQLSLTCVDDDSEALVHANNLLKRRAPAADIVFRQASPDQLPPDAEGISDFDFIGSLYTADRSNESSLVRILLNSYRWLRPGGCLLLMVFGDAVPDWLLLEVLLNWTPRVHSQRELQDVAARSPFGQSSTEVTVSATGLNLFLRAVKVAS